MQKKEFQNAISTLVATITQSVRNFFRTNSRYMRKNSDVCTIRKTGNQ
jgi:hypothetical protein